MFKRALDGHSSRGRGERRTGQEASRKGKIWSEGAQAAAADVLVVMVGGGKKGVTLASSWSAGAHGTDAKVQ